jgi:hypothetical protein
MLDVVMVVMACGPSIATEVDGYDPLPSGFEATRPRCYYRQIIVGVLR